MKNPDPMGRTVILNSAVPGTWHHLVRNYHSPPQGLDSSYICLPHFSYTTETIACPPGDDAEIGWDAVTDEGGDESEKVMRWDWMVMEIAVHNLSVLMRDAIWWQLANWGDHDCWEWHVEQTILVRCWANAGKCWHEPIQGQTNVMWYENGAFYAPSATTR